MIGVKNGGQYEGRRDATTAASSGSSTHITLSAGNARRTCHGPTGAVRATELATSWLWDMLRDASVTRVAP